MLNGYLTPITYVVILFQFLSMINIIFILHLLEKKNMISLYANKKINQRLISILFWIIMLLPISSLFLLKMNVLTNMSSTLLLILIILIFVNTAILVSYWLNLVNKINFSQISTIKNSYISLMYVLLFITLNVIYFIWTLLIL